MVPLFMTSFGEGPGASLFQGLFFLRFLTSNDFNLKKYASGLGQLLGGWLEYTLKPAPKTSFEKRYLLFTLLQGQSSLHDSSF